MENNENTLSEKYKDSHGSGVISTMVFMAVGVIMMMLIKHFLHY